MENHEDDFSIETMSQILNVSRSGYYDWLVRPISRRELADKELFMEVEKIYYEFSRRYGSDRIHKELRDREIRTSRKRVERIMAENDLKSIYNTRKKVKTTDSNHDLPVSPNLLNREFEVMKPNLVWVSDITYIHSRQGWLYLCQIKDLFSRKVVGWSIADHMRTEMVLEALDMAVKTRSPKPGLLFHSDRGSQYCSRIFRDALNDYQMISSMSRKGNCWDNAPAESFFATLKCELVNHVFFKNLDDAKRQIFQYIEFFYNRIRKHSSLGYLSPALFEKKNAA